MKTDLSCGKMQLAGEVGVEERIERSDADVPEREDGQVADDERILGEDFRLHAAGLPKERRTSRSRAEGSVPLLVPDQAFDVRPRDRKVRT
jgi:hypothetical protein